MKLQSKFGQNPTKSFWVIKGTTSIPSKHVNEGFWPKVKKISNLMVRLGS